MKARSRAGPAPPVIVVMLRQPRMNKATEMRSDPFWEFGSFGLTGCHQRNLMHPKKCAELAGARFAFVQGGKLGQRLVYLSAPVTATPFADRSEVTWTPAIMPFRYEAAPLVLDSKGHSQMPLLRELITDCKRNSWLGKFASKFRTRREALPTQVAQQVIATYEEQRRKAKAQDIATSYEQALPMAPPCIDRKRRQTFRQLKQALS